MNRRIFDRALFFKKDENCLHGLCANYVYNTLHAGTERNSDNCKRTEKLFECKLREWNKSQFAGLKSKKHVNGFLVFQRDYIRILKLFSKLRNLTNFTSPSANLT